MSGPPAVISCAGCGRDHRRGGRRAARPEPTLVFSLTVTDRSGVSAADEVTVTVSPPDVVNDPPVADAGSDQAGRRPGRLHPVRERRGSRERTADLRLEPGERSARRPSTSPTEAQTAVDGVPGGAEGVTLVFSLTVTDAGGLSSSDDLSRDGEPGQPAAGRRCGA